MSDLVAQESAKLPAAKPPMIPQIIIYTGVPAGCMVPITAPMPTPTDPPTCPAIDETKMRPVYFKNFFPEISP